MKLRSLNYYITEAFKGFARNSLMSLTGAATVASCVFMLVAGVCVALNVDYILKQFENKVGISVFIDDELSTEDVQALYRVISELRHVADVKYVSPEDALREFAALYENSEEVFADLEAANPLRRSFTILLDAGRNQNEVLDALLSARMREMGVANVRHARESMNAFVAANNVVRVVAVIMIGILGALSVVIIMNTIKLAVNNRRSEIIIMKYVGATDWFIKWPFVIEGMLIGLLGAAIAAGVCWPLYARLSGRIFGGGGLDGLIELMPNMAIFPMLTPLALGLGLVIGVIGSVSSMRRYLDV